MALITQRFTGDKVVEMGSEMLIRPMTMGSNWTKIRIGIRSAFYATSTVASAGLMLGVCVGNDQDYDSLYVDLVGGHFGTTIFGSQYTFVPGAFPYLITDTVPLTKGVTKFGATVVSDGAASSQDCFSADPAKFRTINFVDITKGTTTYTVKPWVLVVATVTVDRNRQTYQTWLLDEATAGGVLQAGSTAVPAYIGTGLLDSVFVRWNKSSVPLCISDLSVVRFT